MQGENKIIQIIRLPFLCLCDNLDLDLQQKKPTNPLNQSSRFKKYDMPQDL
jgi:hypothetical protein